MVGTATAWQADMEACILLKQKHPVTEKKSRRRKMHSLRKKQHQQRTKPMPDQQATWTIYDTRAVDQRRIMVTLVVGRG